MRETHNAQASIFDCYAKHEIGNQLAMMSDILDNSGEVINWVQSDLTDERAQPTGRTGLPVESVLRCAILKQVRQLSYKELAFYLEDSGSFRSFARLPQGVVPKNLPCRTTSAASNPRPGSVLIRRSLAGHWLMKWSMVSKSGSTAPSWKRTFTPPPTAVY